MKTLALALLLSTAIGSPEANRIVIDTTGWRPNQAQVVMVDATTRVTVARNGDVRHVTVERLGITNRYTLEPVDGELQVTSADIQGRLILSPDRIVVDGVSLDKAPQPLSPRSKAKPRYYVCPKDQTMLRVPHDRHNGEFKCPVDGTRMKPAVGHQSAIFLLEEEK